MLVEALVLGSFAFAVIAKVLGPYALKAAYRQVPCDEADLPF